MVLFSGMPPRPGMVPPGVPLPAGMMGVPPPGIFLAYSFFKKKFLLGQ
jgi:hypothetical protein